MPPSRKRNKCLKKGDNFVVTIEELVNDCILVSLIYQNRKFCGALMDTTKTKGPYGIPQDEIQPKEEEKSEAETPIDPKIYNHKNPFPQPLLTRKSYSQKVPQPLQRNVFKRARRSRRKARMNMLRSSGKDLRQRNWKFLSHAGSCKCDQCVAGVDKKSAPSTSNSKFKGEPISGVKLEKFQDDTPETSSDDERGVNLPEEIASPIKNLLPRKSQTVQRSPIIKITFKSPGGRGRTIKIPSKLHSPTQNKGSGRARSRKILTLTNDKSQGSSNSSSERLPGSSSRSSDRSEKGNLKRSQLNHAKKEQTSRILKRAKLSSSLPGRNMNQIKNLNTSSAAVKTEHSDRELRVILEPLEPKNDTVSQVAENFGPDEPNEPNSISIDVSTCKTPFGILTQGDIVWGKLTGYPWWPSKVVKLTTTKTDGKVLQQFAKVSWFPKSSTTSIIPLKGVQSFKKCYNERFQKNRRGVYQKAVKAAEDALDQISPEVRKLIAQFET